MSKGMGYHYSGTKGHIIDVAQNLPQTPASLLNNGWKDISNPKQSAAGHYELQEQSTGLKIRYDKGKAGSPGYKGKDHYHVFNPNATSNKDLYLDKDGNPVSKSSSKSHILPKGGK